MRSALTRAARSAALVAAAAAALLSQRAACEAAAAMQPIFAGAFGPGWAAAQSSYSWGGTVAAVPGRGRRGGSALCATLRPWGGASLAALPPAPPLEPAALLSLFVVPHGAAPLNISALQLVLTSVDDAGPLRPESSARLSRFCAPPDCARDARGWTQLSVPLLEFGPWAWSRLSLKDASGSGAAFCVDDVFAASMLSAARWALLDDSAAAQPPSEAMPPAEAAAPPEPASRVDFWMTWDGGAAALPAEGTPERDAFLRALRRDVADWLASAAGVGDAKALRLKITQVRTQEDGRLAVRFKLSMPADSDADAAASRRLLDARSAVAGAASAAQARAEAAGESIAGMLRRNSLPQPMGPVLRALGRGRISGVAVEDARAQAAAAPAPAENEPEPEPEPVAVEAPAVAPVASAPAPSLHEADIAVASMLAHAEAERRAGDGGAASPAPAPAPAPTQHRAPSSPPAVLLVVAALSAMLLGLGALICCAALTWRCRRLPQQAAIAQRAWLQGWNAGAQGGKQIPVLELGACGDGDTCHAPRR